MTIAITPVWTKSEAQAHDAKLAELSDIAYAIQDRVETLAERAMHAAGARQIFYSQGKAMSLDGRRPCSWSDIKAVAAGEIAPGKWGDVQRAGEFVAEHGAAVAELAAARAVVRAHDDAGYRGWPRFFLVPDGHIHASTGCSSLRITTRIGWLPALSGETQESAVAAHGCDAMHEVFSIGACRVDTRQGRSRQVPEYLPGAGLAWPLRALQRVRLLRRRN